MPRPSKRGGELFPDAVAIQQSLELHTRAALLRRHGPQSEIASLPNTVDREKARGIGFAVDLVRAILDGRKTQTRRLMRPQPGQPPHDAMPRAENCPIARPGEVLYVREPWLRTGDVNRPVFYAVDEPPETCRKFKPAMYMPRDLARLWLRVTDVRAERLSTMTPGDLAAEGLPAGQTFERVWNTFYTDAGHRFADDPWVWTLRFDVVR